MVWRSGARLGMHEHVQTHAQASRDGHRIDPPIDWNGIIDWQDELDELYRTQFPFEQTEPVYSAIPHDAILSHNAEHHGFTNTQAHICSPGSSFASGTFDVHNKFRLNEHGFPVGYGGTWQAAFEGMIGGLDYPDGGGITINHPTWFSKFSDEQVLQITREFNFSESTFVLPADDVKNTAKVRIFTPGGELPFAGHPNVGTAYVLAKTGAITTVEGENLVTFEEKAGLVPVVTSVTKGEPVNCELTAPEGLTLGQQFAPGTSWPAAVLPANTYATHSLSARQAAQQASCHGTAKQYAGVRIQAIAVKRRAFNR